MSFNAQLLAPASPLIPVPLPRSRRSPASKRPSRRLGLAAMLDDPDQTVACGHLTLVANSNVRWLAIEGSPGRSGSLRVGRRVAVTRARLRFGMPTLCFAERPGSPIEVMRAPFRDPLVEAVSDRVVEKLASVRDGTEHASPSPARWFPQAYLGYPSGSADDLFRQATREQAIGRTLVCRGCRRDVDASRPLPSQWGRSDVAACPVCGRVQRWLLGDAVPTRFVRHVADGFIRRFCRAITDRLPLRATGPCTYGGCSPLSPARDIPNLPDARTRRLDLIAHEFRCSLSGKRRFVYLPASASVEATVGQALDAGEVWCHVLPSAPDALWRSLSRPSQYTRADSILGGDVWSDHLKRVWFDHQGITCEELGEHQRLWPADLIAFAAGGPLRPIGLYWDFEPARRCMDEPITATAAVFPPIRLRADKGPRMTLPGEVAVDASSAGPQANPLRHGERRHDRRMSVGSASGILARQAC